ncbi:MAG: tetratricopeptide repeat protein, partial [Spirochaetaceae bacterium]|nr:tetratricopeptide repeat protein [Spirochaetaceae bacterium]
MNNFGVPKQFCSPLFLIVVCAGAVISSCATWGASAEEYYSLGMAYFELGKFEEAEKWLNRAR